MAPGFAQNLPYAAYLSNTGPVPLARLSHSVHRPRGHEQIRRRTGQGVPVQQVSYACHSGILGYGHERVGIR